MSNAIFRWQRRRFCSFFGISLFSLVIIFFLLTDRSKISFVKNNFSETSPINKCIIYECTIEQSQKHGDLFASFKSDWSSCYSDLYLRALDDHETPVHILIDVGANKAYAVSAWVAFFLPELGIDQAKLGQYLTSTNKVTSPCGSCNDCQDEPLKRRNIQQKMKLQIHAFEPQPGTVDVLEGIHKWMNISERSESIFEIHGMAVSDHTGQALFKKCNAGNEVCSLDISAASTNEQVQVDIITLDEFAAKHNLSIIDILKIDTEGYEPFVSRGAKRLLQEHRIRLFIFEYLTEGAWRNTSLQIEVSNLSKLGYVCYIVGKTGLLRVSHCWSERFNIRHNNLLCVSSKDKRLMYSIDRMRLMGSAAVGC